jgi:hypothetical protein
MMKSHEDIFQMILQRPALDDHEHRESELIGQLWKRIEKDPIATHITASLIAHQSILISRLKNIIGTLLDEICIESANTRKQ